MSGDTIHSASSNGASSRRVAIWLCVVFGGLYFAQGFVEPTEGLISQPLRSLQSQWGRTTAQLTSLAAIISIPWSIKPLFGLLIDFVPLGRSGPRGYLLCSSLILASVFMLLFFMQNELQHSPWLIPLLLICTSTVAVSDVAVDALMVRYGQPLGLTGRLQSVQWSCIYAASFIAGPLGGELSHRDLHAYAFVIAGVLAMCSFALVFAWRPGPSADHHNAADAQSETPSVDPAKPKFSLWVTVVFLMLWNFNPFSSSVQYSFMKEHLNFDERFIGINSSAFAAGAMIASVAYGTYCQRIAFQSLLRLSVIAGILATLAYLAMVDRSTAMVVSVVGGLTYMTGTMIQLDLAARACPPRYAGTVFSSLMAASNFSVQMSTSVGGQLFDWMSETWTPSTAFRLLVVLGAFASGLCWLLIPRLTKDDKVDSPSQTR